MCVPKKKGFPSSHHPEAPIDDHALHNTTSVYTAAKVFPMLPIELSYGLTSLNPDEDRKSFIMDITYVSPDEVEVVSV